MARNHFGENHQKYADSLLDYGFFLLNVDAIVKSVQAYKVILLLLSLNCIFLRGLIKFLICCVFYSKRLISNNLYMEIKI